MAWSRLHSLEPWLFRGILGMFFLLSIGTSPLFVAGGTVLGGWVISGRFAGDLVRFRKSPLAWPLLLMILLPLIGLLHTPAGDGMRIAARGYYWLFPVVVAATLRGPRRPELLITAFLAGLSINSLAAILQFAGLLPLKYGHPVGFFPGSSPWIVFSVLLTAGALIASFRFSRSGTPGRRALYLVLIVQYLFTISFLGGRTGYLAVLILFPVLAVNILRHRGLLLLLFGLSLIPILIFSYPVLRDRSAMIRSDLVQYERGNVNTSIGLRFHMWQVALAEVRQRPLTGVGTNGFKHAWAEKKLDPSLPFIDHPHNSFLHVLTSFGIPGLAAFCWLLAVIFRQSWKARDTELGFSALLYAAAFSIGSMTDTLLVTTPTVFALALFTGLSEASAAALRPASAQPAEEIGRGEASRGDR